MSTANEFSTRFQHKPLDHPSYQIRLVKLLPKAKDGLLQCTVRHETLGNRHVALSYVWGEPEKTRDIPIQGKILTVRENLWNFLVRQNEHDRSTRSYWIDQICINQDDIVEKNHQVDIMGQIYKRAKTAFIWLGSADEGIIRAMREARYSSMSIVSEVYNDHKFKAYDTGRDDTWQTRSMARINDRMAAKLGGHERQWDLFDQLVTNNYWCRAWTVPEFVLAKDLKLISGTSEVSLRHFLNAYHAVLGFKAVSQYYEDPRFTARLTAFVSGRQYKWKMTHWRTTQLRQEITLEDWLHNFKDHPGMCEKQVDSIYSLLGLVERQCFVKPDYLMVPRTLYRHVFICEWDMHWEPKRLANAIAKRLGLDPEEEWKQFLTYLGIRDQHDYTSESHQELQKAVRRERVVLFGAETLCQPPDSGR